MDYKPETLVYSCGGARIQIDSHLITGSYVGLGKGDRMYTCQIVGEHCLDMEDARKVGEFLIDFADGKIMGNKGESDVRCD